MSLAIPSVTDFGAVGDGATDSTPAFAAAAASVGPGGVVGVPQGTFRLATVPAGTRNVGWIEVGTKYSPSFPPWQTNGGVYGNAWMIVEGESDVPRHALFVSQKIRPTNSAASYESSAIYARVFSTDPTVTTPGGQSRDAVGVIGQALIGYGCNPGSATGANFVAQAVDASADGRLGGIEVDIIPTVDQPQLDTPTQKQGVLVVGFNKLSTAAVRVSAVGGGKWQYGIRVDGNAIPAEGFPISITGTFGVKLDGSVVVGAETHATGGKGVIAMKNAAAVPTSNFPGGGVLYVEAGKLKYRGSSGTVTTLALA